MIHSENLYNHDFRTKQQSKQTNISPRAKIDLRLTNKRGTIHKKMYIKSFLSSTYPTFLTILLQAYSLFHFYQRLISSYCLLIVKIPSSTRYRFIESNGTKIKNKYSSIGNPKRLPMLSSCEKDHRPNQTES